MPPLIEGMPLWLAETNAWIVTADPAQGECVLVDAPPDPTAIIERLNHHGLRLVALLSTHGHVDHVGGMGTVARTAPGAEVEGGVPTHIHEHDKHMLLDPVGTSGGFGQMLVGTGLDLRPPEVIHGLDDGQVVKGAGLTFSAIHTPGHTQGSVCLRLDLDGLPPILFSGDHLFAGSIGRTDLPGGSYDMLMQSMAERIMPMPDDVAVLPGHGPTTTIGREKATNPFLQELKG
jgi:glyoxylase-like metal-dependent hydrolase (beta-lactamase superfamily II)